MGGGTMKQDYIERAEDMAETAQKLAEQHEEQYSKFDEPTLLKLPVVGTKETGNDTHVNVVVSLNADEQKIVTVPWPSDTTDDKEPLVRLTKKYDVSLEDITEMKELWVYTEDGEEFEIVIPSQESSRFMHNPIIQPHDAKKFVRKSSQRDELYATESTTKSISKIVFTGGIFVLSLILLLNIPSILTFYGYILFVCQFLTLSYILYKIHNLIDINKKKINKIH